MKSFGTMFLKSLQLPKKEAVFQLNRIGMDITVIYMFIILFISSIPTYIEQLQTNQELSIFFFSIFFFIFHYLPVVVIVFIALSIIAGILSLFAKSVQRKLRFSILWKMAAAATTIPLLIFTLVSFFYPLTSLYLILAILFILIIGIKIIFIYPPIRHR